MRRDEPARSRLSVVGASARAAAGSAQRAGWAVRTSDLFGDDDLRALAEYEPLDGSYPMAFEDFVGRGPEIPWLYTGALENLSLIHI